MNILINVQYRCWGGRCNRPCILCVSVSSKEKSFMVVNEINFEVFFISENNDNNTAGFVDRVSVYINVSHYVVCLSADPGTHCNLFYMNEWSV